MPTFNLQRTKVQLKLAVERTKMLQEKKEAIAKKDRKEISHLIQRHKEESARIKCEGIIAEDIHIELLEILELYCETLLARFALLDLPEQEPEPSIVEPVAAIIHAAPRVELRELHMLRDMLISRYGKVFATKAIENKEGIVGNRVASRLKIQTPSKQLVDLYISEICKAYDVPFSSPYIKSAEEEAAEAEAAEAKEEQGMPPPAEEPVLDPKAAPATQVDLATLKANGNVSEKGATGLEPGKGVTTTTESGSANRTLGGKKEEDASKKEQEKEKSAYDDLEARFAALKKR